MKPSPAEELARIDNARWAYEQWAVAYFFSQEH